MPEIQMSLVQISSGCFSDLSGCINIIFNFLSEVEIFAILLNMEFAARTYICKAQKKYSGFNAFCNWAILVCLML